MAYVLSAGGLSIIEMLMLGCFAVTVPWIAIGFWNAVIGFLILYLSRSPFVTVAPGLQHTVDGRQIRSRTALVMPIYNEDAARAFHGLQTTVDSLDATGESGSFEIFVLSDTNDPEIAAEEEAWFAAWRGADRRPERLHYRRRSQNTGFKAGNVRDFVEGWGERFDHMIVLDADSVMAGEAILRLVRLMEANPRLGILQTLVVGLPTASIFARVFQFGMRHGMRSYTAGSAWWQAYEGPYWGHNAIIRVAPFRDHCELPLLPGTPPLGGHVLSHDQVEAVLMQRAGYEVRVIPEEGGSYEENPPTLPDFLKRDLRWCQGNMQYFKLLAMPGLRPLGRLHLVLAILMYLSAPAWFGFLLIGFGCAVYAGLSSDGSSPIQMMTTGEGLLLFIATLTMALAPKLFGLLDIVVRASSRAAYGGAIRIGIGAVGEILFSTLLAPVVTMAQTVFISGLMFGKRVRWDAQARDGRAVAIGDAMRGLWPQTLAGLGGAAVLAVVAPGVLPWAAPVMLGLGLAVPLACLSSRRRPGRWLAWTGLFGIPEERRVPAEVQQLGLAPMAPALAARPVEQPAIGALDQPVAVRARST